MTERCSRVTVRIPQWAGYGREIYRGIASFLTERRLHWRMETELAGDQETRPSAPGEDWQGDGAIFFRYDAEEAERLRARDCAVVSISRISPLEWVPRVHMDNGSIGRLAAGHLLATGAPRFAYWGAPDREYSQERLDGFREVIEGARKPLKVLGHEASRIKGPQRWKRIYREMKKQLKRLELPVAVLARDDIAAYGLVDVARELGIDVPRQMAVLGVGDDAVLCSVASPPLSSVVIEAEEIGYRAAEMLESEMTRLRDGGKTAAEPPVMALEAIRITRRDSTDLVMVDDASVAQGWSVIRQRAGRERLTVADLRTVLGVSGTTLTKRFRAALGSSPKELIDRTCYEEALHLLDLTSWSIKEVAYEMGFRTPEEFDRFFKRMGGMTPGGYREGRLR